MLTALCARALEADCEGGMQLAGESIDLDGLHKGSLPMG